MVQVQHISLSQLHIAYDDNISEAKKYQHEQNIARQNDKLTCNI